MEQKCIDNGLSELGCSLISGGLYFSYVLFFVAVAALVILPTMNVLKAPKELVKSGLGVGGLVILFGIAYVMSGDELTLKTQALGTTHESSKMIGAGLIMLYFIFFISVGGLIYSFINKALK